MKCERCGFENPQSFTFCGKCGSPLSVVCPQCGFENPQGFAFCGKCGKPLAAQDRLTTADLEHLRTYLPLSLVQSLQFDLVSPPPRLLEQCTAHLGGLLEMVRAHLPAFLVERVLSDPAPGKIGGQFVHGTLLFADISGFTAMSERLSRVGREGAEEITSIVNRYFDTMLSILREQGGQLITFGGDALLGLFVEPESAVRAAQTALAMQVAMAGLAHIKTSQGIFPLQMKVGLHRGRFLRRSSARRKEWNMRCLGRMSTPRRRPNLPPRQVRFCSTVLPMTR
jgi:class 3 adenylate cyclase/ribosomal protein L40E